MTLVWHGILQINEIFENTKSELEVRSYDLKKTQQTLKETENSLHNTVKVMHL